MIEVITICLTGILLYDLKACRWQLRMP